MNLKEYKNKYNLTEDTVVIDGESMVLSLLLRERFFGLSMSTKAIEDYQNRVIAYFAKKNTPVRFTYLEEDNLRLIEEKRLGLKEGVKLELTDEELENLTDEVKCSPCIEAHRDSGEFCYQLTQDILNERENPAMFNGAIRVWTAQPYYTCLLRQLAPDCTVDKRTRGILSVCGDSFVESLDEKDQKTYFGSYIVDEKSKVEPAQKQDPDEKKADSFFTTARDSAYSVYTPAYIIDKAE